MQSSKGIENLHSQILGFPRVGNYSKPRVLKRRGVGGNPVIVAGVDEAGRGPLAGPVVACALVILTKRAMPNRESRAFKSHPGILKDSKQLTPKQREEWYRFFLHNPNIQWGIGRVSERVIDRINIYQATRLAMERAVWNLSKKVALNFLFIDGNMRITTSIPQKAVVRGDEKIQLCSAASIVAKVTRDHIMMRYHKQYPRYGFDRHKGYGTVLHLARLKKYGPCSIHRKTFSPINTLASLRNP
ncbi:MAG: ribonuclease HII [bacterium]|nr:ribonuclease HII [bacterium]